jgi:hypothetical protein
LLAVQGIDTELDRARHRRATLAERGELAAIDHDLAALEARLATAREERDAAARAQEAVEQTLGGVERHAADVKKRLYGGTVSATRELQAMAAELDSLTARASELESRALEGMEAWEPLDARVDELEGEKGARTAQRAAVAASLLAHEADADEEIERLHVARAQAAAAVPPDLVVTYERLRDRLGGVGAARLVGTHCGGCHLTLPATELDRLRHQPAGTVSFCDQCGRILVPTRTS